MWNKALNLTTEITIIYADVNQSLTKVGSGDNLVHRTAVVQLYRPISGLKMLCGRKSAVFSLLQFESKIFGENIFCNFYKY